jgi:lipopolysaccharide export system protein LptA
MIKAILMFLGIVGIAVFASGQSAGAPDVLADHIRVTSATTVQYRGNVQLKSGNVTVTADEADSTVQPNATIDFALRGNVHLSTE